jgi:glucokinase
LLDKVNLTTDDVVGVGMGVPGMIDSERGEVVYSNNLGWADFSIAKEVENALGLPVKIANDANVAALGEARFGCGKGCKTSVMITLGTGVGSGIVIDGKLFEGNRSAGAEIGHSVIVAGGEPCTCGRRGCFEAYASATALIRDTKRAMEAHPESKMWEAGSLDAVTGKTPFDYYDTDEAARAVVDGYIEKLGVGVTNIANEFRPEMIMLGGGVCSEGEKLTTPLKAFVEREIFAGKRGPEVKITIAKLENDAGLLGAAALFM